MFKDIIRGYQAVIFDMDGTIIYSQHLWEKSLRKVVSGFIKSNPPYFSEKGINLLDRLADIKNNNELSYDYDIEKTYHQVNQEFFDNFHQVIVVPGFEEFIGKLKDLKIKTALVTNTDREIAQEILNKLDLGKFFDLMLFRQDVSKGKPAPEIYELAVKKLAVPKKTVLVFEDSPAGAYAANLAQLNVIVVADIYHEETHPADFGSNNRIFVKDFEEIAETLDETFDDYVRSYT